MASHEKYDAIVCGAGIAGIAAACALLEADAAARVDDAHGV